MIVGWFERGGAYQRGKGKRGEEMCRRRLFTLKDMRARGRKRGKGTRIARGIEKRARGEGEGPGVGERGGGSVKSEGKEGHTAVRRTENKGEDQGNRRREHGDGAPERKGAEVTGKNGWPGTGQCRL